MILGASQMDEVAYDSSTNIATILTIFFAFYIFGIIVWIFPYLLLALILFFLSFISRAKTTLKIFTFSPLAMTILTIATLNILALGTAGEGTMLSNPGIIDQDFISLNILGAAFTLIWGYICVGIGYGIYRLLQLRQIIRDQEIVVAPQSV